MKTVEPIHEYHDKIVYYDVDGKIITEERILNSFHPHTYHSIRNGSVKKITLQGKEYSIVGSSIDYTHRNFGVLQVTHLYCKSIV